MAPMRDPAAQRILETQLQEHGLSDDSLLYREVERHSLTPTGTPGRYRLRANQKPAESVVDV